MTKDEALRRPTIRVYTAKVIDIEIKMIEPDLVWYTSMSRKGPKAHKAKIYDTDSEPWFVADDQKVFLRNCKEV